MDDLDVFMPAGIIKRVGGKAEDAPHILDTTVYRIETGAYVRDAIMPLVDALKAADEAIEAATADYLTALGVRVERHLADDPENGGNIVPFMMGEVTAHDYARRVRLCADGQVASKSIVWTWHHTPVGWLVTYEASDSTGEEYCYEFLM